MSVSSEAVIAYLAERIGFNADAVSRKTVLQAVEAQMEACGLTAAAYLRRLKQNPSAMTDLINAVAVPETWFFRDPGAFEHLTSVARSLKPADRPLHALSIPCSTGEEPYSMAMTLLEAGLTPAQIRILALDVNPKALERARAGLYGRLSLRAVTPDRLDRFFTPEGENYRVAPGVADLVRFETGNILDYESLAEWAPYDLIFCRNLLIYLTEEARSIAVGRLNQALRDGGLVFLGYAESRSHFFPHHQPVEHPRAYGAYKRAAPKKNQAFTPPQPPRSPRPPAQPQRRREPASVKAPPDRPRPGEASTPPRRSPLEDAQDLADQGRLDEALDCCRRILEAEPVNADAHHLFAVAALAKGLDDEAARGFGRVLYLQPHHLDALTHMALLMDKAGRAEQAARYRRRLKRLMNAEGSP